MGLLPAVLGNANKQMYSFLLTAAIMGFLLGMLTSPLLNCNDPNQTMKLPALVVDAVPADPSTQAVREAPSTDPLPVDLITFPSKCEVPISPSDVRDLVLSKIYDGISPFEGFPPKYAIPWLGDKRIWGWGSYDKVFERLVTEVKPRIILELGSFLGASATHMVTVSKSQGRDVLVLCVDDFRGWPGFRNEFKFEQIHGDVQLLYQFLRNVQTLNMTESILPIPFATTSSMSSLCTWGVYADLIEVDAGHDFHSAWDDINLAHLLLSTEGVMFGDDYYNWGVGRAVDLFAKLKGLRVETDDRHWILRSR